MRKRTKAALVATGGIASLAALILVVAAFWQFEYSREESPCGEYYAKRTYRFVDGSCSDCPCFLGVYTKDGRCLGTVPVALRQGAEIRWWTEIFDDSTSGASNSGHASWNFGSGEFSYYDYRSESNVEEKFEPTRL